MLCPTTGFYDLFSSRRQPASVRVNERFLIFSPLAPTIAPFRVFEMQEFFITKTDLLASAASIILQSVKYQLIFVQNISFTEKIKNMFFVVTKLPNDSILMRMNKLNAKQLLVIEDT